jgi:hypothetical protein
MKETMIVSNERKRKMAAQGINFRRVRGKWQKGMADPWQLAKGIKGRRVKKETAENRNGRLMITSHIQESSKLGRLSVFSLQTPYQLHL